jgi:hypothetical protein
MAGQMDLYTSHYNIMMQGKYASHLQIFQIKVANLKGIQIFHMINNI